MPTPANFIQVACATPTSEPDMAFSPPKLETTWRTSTIYFDQTKLISYGKYFDQNKNSGTGGYDNNKTQINLGTTGFIYNGNISDFENELVP